MSALLQVQLISQAGKSSSSNAFSTLFNSGSKGSAGAHQQGASRRKRENHRDRLKENITDVGSWLPGSQWRLVS